MSSLTAVSRSGAASLSQTLLRGVRAGDGSAVGGLFQEVYGDLRSLAAGQLARERPGHTLQPTALVHEAFLKLSGRGMEVADRGHFLGIAARAMRQILVDHARRRLAEKRGGGLFRTTLGGSDPVLEMDPAQLLDLDRALASLSERQRRVVELRFFAGLEEGEVGEVLGVAERTVRRDWVKARAWLYSILYSGDDGGGVHRASGSMDPEDP